MLVIGRRPGETLVIGDDIEIEVLDASGSQVKLGIRAPKWVPVVRKEIRVVSEQNQAASRAVTAEHLKQVLNAVEQTRPPKPSSTPISLR